MTKTSMTIAMMRERCGANEVPAGSSIVGGGISLPARRGRGSKRRRRTGASAWASTVVFSRDAPPDPFVLTSTPSPSPSSPPAARMRCSS